jgi:excisionase family DNA binding protein
VHVADRHLSIKEFADRLGLPPATIERWNSRGGGPRYLRVGRHVRYRLADIIAWEESRLVDPNDVEDDQRHRRAS